MATQKKKAPWMPLSEGGLNHPMKAVKMVEARCRECNPRGQGKRGWAETCPHDPYFSMQPAAPPRPKFEEQEDGTFKQVGVEEPRYVRRPNWVQIADDAKVLSGRLVRIHQERGSKFPEDFDWPSVCDYYNCWETNPKINSQKVVAHEGVQTVVGRFHSRDEAAIVQLRLEGRPIYVGVDHDINNRRQQLDQVNVS